MAWKIVEVSPDVDNDTLTDEQLVQLYTLVSHGSASFHAEITSKLEQVAKTATDNLHQESRWENEGGAQQKKTE